MRVIDNKTKEHTVFYAPTIEGSPSREFNIIVFYDEGARLVAVI